MSEFAPSASASASAAAAAAAGSGIALRSPALAAAVAQSTAAAANAVATPAGVQAVAKLNRAGQNPFAFGQLLSPLLGISDVYLGADANPVVFSEGTCCLDLGDYVMLTVRATAKGLVGVDAEPVAVAFGVVVQPNVIQGEDGLLYAFDNGDILPNSPLADELARSPRQHEPVLFVSCRPRVQTTTGSALPMTLHTHHQQLHVGSGSSPITIGTTSNHHAGLNGTSSHIAATVSPGLSSSSAPHVMPIARLVASRISSVVKAWKSNDKMPYTSSGFILGVPPLRDFWIGVPKRSSTLQSQAITLFSEAHAHETLLTLAAIRNDRGGLTGLFMSAEIERGILVPLASGDRCSIEYTWRPNSAAVLHAYFSIASAWAYTAFPSIVPEPGDLATFRLVLSSQAVTRVRLLCTATVQGAGDALQLVVKRRAGDLYLPVPQALPFPLLDGDRVTFVLDVRYSSSPEPSPFGVVQTSSAAVTSASPAAAEPISPPRQQSPSSGGLFPHLVASSLRLLTARDGDANSSILRGVLNVATSQIDFRGAPIVVSSYHSSLHNPHMSRATVAFRLSYTSARSGALVLQASDVRDVHPSEPRRIEPSSVTSADVAHPNPRAGAAPMRPAPSDMSASASALSSPAAVNVPAASLLPGSSSGSPSANSAFVSKSYGGSPSGAHLPPAAIASQLWVGGGESGSTPDGSFSRFKPSSPYPISRPPTSEVTATMTRGASIVLPNGDPSVFGTSPVLSNVGSGPLRLAADAMTPGHAAAAAAAEMLVDPTAPAASVLSSLSTSPLDLWANPVTPLKPTSLKPLLSKKVDASAPLVAPIFPFSDFALGSTPDLLWGPRSSFAADFGTSSAGSSSAWDLPQLSSALAYSAIRPTDTMQQLGLPGNQHPLHHSSGARSSGFVSSATTNVLNDGNVCVADRLRFDPKNILGQGAHQVFEGDFRTPLGTYKVAVKVVGKVAANNYPEYLKEVDTLRTMSHPNIIRIYDHLQNDKYHFIVMKKAAFTMHDFVRQQSDHYRPDMRIKHVRQLFDALSFCHSQTQPIIHGDIKPSNVLLTDTLDLLLSDFGGSRHTLSTSALDSKLGAASPIPSQPGTPRWRAPEVMLEQRFSTAGDIFSLGLVVYFMLSDGEHAFQGDAADELVEQYVRENRQVGLEAAEANGAAFITQHPGCCALITRMIDADREKRPSIRDVMAHPLTWTDEERHAFVRSCHRAIRSFKDLKHFIVNHRDGRIVWARSKHWNRVFLDGPQEHQQVFHWVSRPPDGPYGDTLADLLVFACRSLDHIHEAQAEVRSAAGKDGLALVVQLFPRLIDVTYAILQEYRAALVHCLGEVDQILHPSTGGSSTSALGSL
ncbi:hypothetical protein CAOG_01915 [Capsaspora owczarzaki ATCC 30864]|uniref:CAMK protein kinase n=1 Tax=Capsaspora owczarzaki (strain ATCC 30864) TaxID=595528 RepID=A0A0D2VKR6_CAPO3|nr:hypothetical protein CAOG_01915 [Capsaspora owczarzaki ATCC 30864]KJE90632.1 CAMK protein kinase [Capsaspora owczarzaki ATCC 30864]|eukprot:XP_004364783.1 hypothetical protein CAOG_01915 [Capsaspora owczarzaki ATCC 30864]